MIDDGARRLQRILWLAIIGIASNIQELSVVETHRRGTEHLDSTTSHHQRAEIELGHPKRIKIHPKVKHYNWKIVITERGGIFTNQLIYIHALCGINVLKASIIYLYIHVRLLLYRVVECAYT